MLEGEYKAIIFDNDGVLVNSEPLSCRALRNLLYEKFNVDIGSDFSPVIGRSDEYAIRYYLNQNNLIYDNDLSGLISRKQEIYFSLARGNLASFQGLQEVLDFLQSKNIPLGIASSGSPEKIQFTIKQLGIDSYFPTITSAVEVARGKPHPDVYLRAADKMGTEPQHCIVIEDSVVGIQGVKRAGMFAIGFTSSYSDRDLEEAGSDLVVKNFFQLLSHLRSVI